MADTRRRVKLYALNSERQWDDRGTGHVTSCYIEKLKGVALLVRAEADGSLLLESKIQPNTAYQKQQDTLIVWSEGQNFDLALSFQDHDGCDDIWESICQDTLIVWSERDNYDLALSFQERGGCDEIWEKICQVQGKDPSVDVTQELVDESEDERYEDTSDSGPPIELPLCEMSNLEEIRELTTTCLSSAIRKDKLAESLEHDNYIQKLLTVFRTCEEVNNISGLRNIFEIFRNIFLLNKSNLFDIMFSDESIMDVIGCLEYDPLLPTPKKHRQYLKNEARFKEVGPISNTELLSKIHQTFRVQYIQDIVLPAPTMFEDNILSCISSFLFFNKVEIVSAIQEDERFLSDIFQQITDDKVADSKKRELVLFLKEYCNFAQNLQPPAKESFYKTLCSLGILTALEITLSSRDAVTKSTSIDILTYMVEFSASIVREHQIHQINHGESEQGLLLVNVMIDQMIRDTDPHLGHAVQLMTQLRILLDPENMIAAANRTEKTEFLTYFYKRSIALLAAPILNITADCTIQKDYYRKAELLALILELLTFCVEHHTYHIKNAIINKDLLRRVLVLLKSSHKFLVLSSIRFLRRILSKKDEFYNRYIIKGDLMKPVLDAFLDNRGRYNLVDSAILEMCEFIASEDIKSLVNYIVERHGNKLESISYAQTFKTLKLKHDQHLDRLNNKYKLTETVNSVAPITRNERYRKDDRDIDDEEEIWFNEDDELEEAVSSSTAPEITPNNFANLKNKLANDELDEIGE